MRNIALLTEYDGTNFHGWQSQKDLRTVQDEIKKAINKLTGESVTLYGCSRTDTGVHAKGHVSNFHTNSRIPIEKFPIALNSHLPKDIYVLHSKEVLEEFHSGYFSTGKIYSYSISFEKKGRALDRNRTYYTNYILDDEKMRQGAKAFIGTHDFKAFMGSKGETKTTIRDIYSLDVLKEENKLKIIVEGNGFLYNMVRIIAGTLYYVGIGKIKSEDVEGIISKGDRKYAGITLPPQGLFLEKVFYKIKLF